MKNQIKFEFFFAVSNNELAAINLPEGLTSIGNYAFEQTAIAELILPNTLTSIGYGAFTQCNNLTAVSIPKHDDW